MSELSLDYYANIFRNNPQRLVSVKELLLKDFKSMETNFFSHAETNDLPALRKELHKIKPIVFNLRFSRMLALIEKYYEGTQFEAGRLHQLNQELRKCLAEIYTFLETH